MSPPHLGHHKVSEYEIKVEAPSWLPGQQAQHRLCDVTVSRPPSPISSFFLFSVTCYWRRHAAAGRLSRHFASFECDGEIIRRGLSQWVRSVTSRGGIEAEPVMGWATGICLQPHMRSCPNKQLFQMKRKRKAVPKILVQRLSSWDRWQHCQNSRFNPNCHPIIFRVKFRSQIYPKIQSKSRSEWNTLWAEFCRSEEY